MKSRIIESSNVSLAVLKGFGKLAQCNMSSTRVTLTKCQMILHPVKPIILLWIFGNVNKMSHIGKHSLVLVQFIFVVFPNRDFGGL